MSTAVAPPRGRDAADTKNRLLDAAERLFAERGFSGTSMRALTQAAGVSVSAANYHFGSKEALLTASIDRVVVPMNEARFARLAELERAAGDRPLSLTGVLDAFLRPAIESRGDALRQVVARLFSDPPDVVAALKKNHFGEVFDRFLPALKRALPEQDPDRVALGFEFLIAVMVHVVSGQIETSLDPGSREVRDDEELISAVIRFAAAGFES